MAKPEEKTKARELRKEGESIKVIAKKLSVSPSSVSYWCRDVELTPLRIRKLERQARDPHYGRRLEYALAQRQKRLEKTEKLRKEGVKEIGKLSKRELFLVGASLYWAEGYKKDTQVGFGSSDPAMIKIFLKWLFKCFNYKVSDLILRVGVNISHEYRIKEIQEYWSEITGVSVVDFRKPFFQKVKWKKVYERPQDYFGVLRVRVRRSTDFLRKINGWIEGLRLAGDF